MNMWKGHLIFGEISHRSYLIEGKFLTAGKLVLFVQHIIAAFFSCFLETAYNVVRIINYTIVRGWSYFSVQPTAFVYDSFRLH